MCVPVFVGGGMCARVCVFLSERRSMRVCMCVCGRVIERAYGYAYHIIASEAWCGCEAICQGASASGTSKGKGKGEGPFGLSPVCLSTVL